MPLYFKKKHAAKRDLADSADAQPMHQIPPGEIVMLLVLINPAASRAFCHATVPLTLINPCFGHMRRIS
jgi:hypothetical protein